MKKPNNLILAQDLGNLSLTFVEKFDERINKYGPPHLSTTEYAKLMIAIATLNNFNTALHDFFKSAYAQKEDPEDELLDDETIIFEFEDTDE